MFLKEIESRRAVGLTGIALKTLRQSGEAIPEILHLFRFKRRSTDHLVRFTEEVMRGPSPLSRGLRELIGAYVSARSRCSFCSDAHAAAAAELLDRDLVREVLSDLETSRLDAAHKALLRYAGKLAENPSSVAPTDIDELKRLGFSEEAIFDVLTVASLFRFYNTWNAGAGVENMTPADYAYSGKVLSTLGYCMDFKFRRLLSIRPGQLWAILRGVAPRPSRGARASARESA